MPFPEMLHLADRHRPEQILRYLQERVELPAAVLEALRKAVDGTP